MHTRTNQQKHVHKIWRINQHPLVAAVMRLSDWDEAHLPSCCLTPQAGRVRLLAIVKEWTVISIEVCVESPFIPPHWANGWGGFQGGLALAQPGAHHQITQLHLWLLTLHWRSSLTLWPPRACWAHWGFPHWATSWGTLHVCPGTVREREKTIISAWSQRMN